MNSMPSRGRKLSKHSKYSWVAAGPPWSSRSLIRGFFPTRLVQTLNVPLGVRTGIFLIPPVLTAPSSLFRLLISGVSLDREQEARSAVRRSQGASLTRSIIVRPSYPSIPRGPIISKRRRAGQAQTCWREPGPGHLSLDHLSNYGTESTPPARLVG